MAAAEAVQAKGLGVGIVVRQVIVDRRHQFGNAPEHPATDAVLGNQAEEALDLVERLSQEAEVGVKCMWNRLCRFSHARTLACLFVL
jgi:hypothetical protein